MTRERSGMVEQWVSSANGTELLTVALALAERQQSSVDEVLQQVIGVVTDVLDRPQVERAPGLGPAESEILLRSGGVDPEKLAEPGVRGTVGGWSSALMRTALRDVVTSMSTTQAADALGISDSAVRHRLAKGTLWSFAVGRERRLPFWQFVQHPEDPDGLAVLPGLQRLIDAFPADASPSDINAAMTTPQSGLEIGDEAVTVVRWVTSGHGADAAVEVLRDMTTVW